MPRSRSRSRSRDRDRRRRSRSRSRDRDRRRSRSRDRSDRHRSSSGRDRDRSRDRDRDSRRGDRDRDRDQHRSSSRSSRDSRSRSRGRDQTRDRDREREGRPASTSAPETSGAAEAASAAAAGGSGRSASAERRARLEAWKASRQQGAAATASTAPAAPETQAATTEAVWAPWDDPTLSAAAPAPSAPAAPPAPAYTAPAAPPPKLAFMAAPPTLPILKPEAAPMDQDDDVDPLDAFMASEVLPEVVQKQMEEAKKREQERQRVAELLAAGKSLPVLAMLEESDEEPEPDLEIKIPTSRVKLLVGKGGETIGKIQHKSKAKVQIKKEEEELNRAFGSGPLHPPKLPAHVRQRIQKEQAAAARMAKANLLLQGSKEQEEIEKKIREAEKTEKKFEDARKKEEEDEEGDEDGEEEGGSGGEEAKPGEPPRKMTTIMIYGDQKAVEIAERMIYEAIDNREQKQKQRQKEYERKREEKRRARQLYHMRHTKDYEALELTPGASKAEVKKAYRRLALLWHPDKHPNNQEEAMQKFQVIQKAFDSLMSTDEEEVQAQIAG